MHYVLNTLKAQTQIVTIPAGTSSGEVSVQIRGTAYLMEGITAAVLSGDATALISLNINATDIFTNVAQASLAPGSSTYDPWTPLLYKLNGGNDQITLVGSNCANVTAIAVTFYYRQAATEQQALAMMRSRFPEMYS